MGHASEKEKKWSKLFKSDDEHPVQIINISLLIGQDINKLEFHFVTRMNDSLKQN